ncbi:MAG: DUF4433 domain-containing protein [Thermomicrobiales bacterium]
MKRADIHELHYITPIENVPSIMAHGILSFRRARSIRHLSVAMPEIQGRREGVTIPGGRRLHEYFNLYFNARNPMLYLRLQEGHHSTLCILRVDATVLDLPGVVIADGNAAAGATAFWASPDGLSRIDNERVFAQYWTDPDPYVQREKKRAIMAEVLVPDRVAPDLVIGACVSCRAASGARALTACNLTTTIEEHLFFLGR